MVFSKGGHVQRNPIGILVKLFVDEMVLEVCCQKKLSHWQQAGSLDHKKIKVALRLRRH